MGVAKDFVHAHKVCGWSYSHGPLTFKIVPPPMTVTMELVDSIGRDGLDTPIHIIILYYKK